MSKSRCGCFQPSKSHVLQLFRIADEVDRDDAAVAMIDGHRIDRTVALAQHEAGKAVDPGGPGRDGGERRVLAGDAGKDI